ncbi:MAG: TetR/AcrR family transcriptional regulator [Firmicutes bacterium]|nr:TetR/AcrR family transcriptional regulator [Bacillota bacterium]
MPKIIENLREKLLAEAKDQIERNGYENTTIRSIASACGVGTGTVYNYFASKDVLIASFMVDDWQGCLAKMKAFPAFDRRAFLENISRCLKEFIEAHASLFYDRSAIGSFSAGYQERHGMLRGQIAGVLEPVCGDDRFLAEFAAESLLCWTIEQKDFDEQYRMLSRLFAHQ